MVLVRNLGLLLQFQKYVTLIQYSEYTKVKTYQIVLRIIPSSFISFYAIYSFFEYINLAVASILKEASITALFAMDMDLIINRLNFLLTFCLGFTTSRSHIRLISSLSKLEKKLTDPSKRAEPSKIFLRSNIDIFINIFFHILIHLSFILLNFENYDHKIILNGHLIQILIMMFNDFLILYGIHFLKEFSNLANLTSLEKNRNILNYFKLLECFLKHISSFNSALAGLLAIIYFQNICSCAISVYIIFWIKFEGDLFEKKFFFFAFIVWAFSAFKNFYYVTYLSTVGNRAKENINILMDSVTKLEEKLPGRFIDKIVIFNKNSLQKWRFHIETRVLVGKSSEINNSGIFSIVSFVSTCLLILLQFKQLEDSSMDSILQPENMTQIQ
uniref:Uncharacterized protein n=1 Tax=Phlebotomus papatasi TaxID=29031 RepID=A0A3F2ZEK5_PHLPP